MRLLADENIPGTVVASLRAAGHDVAWAAEEYVSFSDAEIAAIAASEQRIVITRDKGFGARMLSLEGATPSGIILVRMPRSTAAATAGLLVSVLSTRPDWVGHFTTLQQGRVRSKPIRRGR